MSQPYPQHPGHQPPPTPQLPPPVFGGDAPSVLNPGQHGPPGGMPMGPPPHMPMRPPPKKSNTGLVLGLVIGLVVLLLAGGGFVAWRFGLFGGSGGGATAAGGGEHGVIKELCGSFDHQPFADIAGEEVKVWDEKHEPVSENAKAKGLADVLPEGSHCKMGPASREPETIGGEISGIYTVWADWFVTQDGAKKYFDSSKKSNEEIGDGGYKVTDATVEGTDDAYSVTATNDGTVTLYTLSALTTFMRVTVDVKMPDGGDVETAEKAARQAIEEVIAASAKLA